MPKYISENCFEYIEWQSVYIEKFKNENNNLYLTFKNLEITNEHPLNPFETEWETDEAVVVFYDFEVLDSGYYDCSQVQKQVKSYDKCPYVPISLLHLINDFTIVTENIKRKNKSFFIQTFEGFPWQYGEDNWGYFKLKYKRIEMMWDSFYNQDDNNVRY
ncbi:hypothetical protein [Neobacillus mesonae]|uniref:Uncharacterized protein n=1 Tax=Neobacillus mesonae TaxID=1193713 RepID=A0A3Q9QVN8_9BACI|nr:hypothetical protein [Neobacillus mesonae]AZU62513.1 hypothetical protein CHR53_15185 [Neobacillus mesonae]